MTKAFSKPRFLDASATAAPAFDPPTSAISSTASLTSLQLGQKHYNCITSWRVSFLGPQTPSIFIFCNERALNHLSIRVGVSPELSPEWKYSYFLKAAYCSMTGTASTNGTLTVVTLLYYLLHKTLLYYCRGPISSKGVHDSPPKGSDLILV